MKCQSCGIKAQVFFHIILNYLLPLIPMNISKCNVGCRKPQLNLIYLFIFVLNDYSIVLIHSMPDFLILACKPNFKCAFMSLLFYNIVVRLFEQGVYLK